MHKYMRAIGFSSMKERKKIKELLTEVVMNSDARAYTLNNENVMLGEFRKNFAGEMGIAVCGEFDDEDKFIYDYYYPYLTGSGVTSYEDVSVERHAAKDSYAGVCDDIKVGISLIFYLRNMITYVKAQTTGKLPRDVPDIVCPFCQRDRHDADYERRNAERAGKAGLRQP